MSFIETGFCGGFIFVVDASTVLLLFVLLHSRVCNQQFPHHIIKSCGIVTYFPIHNLFYSSLLRLVHSSSSKKILQKLEFAGRL